MCPPKPKIVQPSSQAAKPKDPAIIRNPYLDGVGPAARSKRTGRSSLRIDKGSPKTARVPKVPAPVKQQPGHTPVRGGGMPPSWKIPKRGPGGHQDPEGFNLGSVGKIGMNRYQMRDM